MRIVLAIIITICLISGCGKAKKINYDANIAIENSK